MPKISFYSAVLICTGISSLTAWSIAHFALHTAVPTSFWICLAVLVIITVVIHRVLQKANHLRPAQFVAYYMGSLTVKLLLAGGILIGIGLLDRPNLAFTAMGFFIVYTLFTGLEIKSLMSQIKAKDSGK